MKLLKFIYKPFVFFLSCIFCYLIAALILSKATCKRKVLESNVTKSIYLNTNGVHLDVILSTQDMSDTLSKGIVGLENSKYIAFGWGDENFYLNTPTGTDLSFTDSFKTLFLKSPSLIHITRLNTIKKDWIEIKVNTTELQKLNNYIFSNFKLNEFENKVLLKGKGYSSNDDFYKAIGSYSCINTCNTWINRGFKKAGLTSCYWTPFDFGLLNKYQD